MKKGIWRLQAHHSSYKFHPSALASFPVTPAPAPPPCISGGSREAHKPSTRLLRGKRLCRTLDTIAYAIRIFRINRVVVGSLRRQLIHAYAENSVVMGWVQPDVRLGSQVQFLGIRAVVHHGKVLGRAARIVAGPPNDGQMLAVQLDLRPLSDFHAVHLF